MEEEVSTIRKTTLKELASSFEDKFRKQSNFIADNADLTAVKNEVARFVGEICAYNAIKARNGYVDMPCRWLTLSGRSGCGKTMLAKEAFEFVKANAGIRERFKTPIEVCGEVRGYDEYAVRNVVEFYEQGELSASLSAPEWRNRRAENAFFIAVDDLGAGHNSDFLIGKLGELLNRRMGKWTMITTNFSQKDMAEILDTRIASRITRDGNVLREILSGDYCLRKSRKENFKC